MSGKNSSNPSLPTLRHKRPFGVTLLSFGVLIVAGINLLRFASSLSQFEFLINLLPVSPLYISITGLVWGLIGLAIFWFLWKGMRNAPLITLVVSAAYFVYDWFERLFIAQADINNWVFILLSNLLIYLWVIFTLYRRKARVFFGDVNE